MFLLRFCNKKNFFKVGVALAFIFWLTVYSELLFVNNNTLIVKRKSIVKIHQNFELIMNRVKTKNSFITNSLESITVKKQVTPVLSSAVATEKETPSRSMMKKSTSPSPKPTRELPAKAIVKQQCIIPKLNPFHPQALPYITYEWTKKCSIHRERTSVKDGHLTFNNSNVKKATLCYIVRYSDNAEDVKCESLHDGKASPSKTKTVKLKHDFMKIMYTEKEDDGYSTEFQMYPVKSKADENFKRYDEKKSKFSILMVMLDSFSHASGKRYINKTYEFLKNDPHSVIMQGHTIVGDATTPQLSAMFFGKQPDEMKPEGRRGFAGAKPIDSWASIIKDYKKHGYVTVYSEDDPGLNAFNFRLMGFKKQPTHKYLRAWWRATNDLKALQWDHEPGCPTEFAINYMKDFYSAYADELSFSIIINAGLTHGTPEKATLVDDTFMELFEDMKRKGKLDSTIVILFGDHGSRATEFRATRQGKMEERLPLMSLTLPPRFLKEFPKQVENLKRNSKVMTTPYDMYATFKHLLSFPNSNFRHSVGKSLFTDIVKLNRNCDDAGVPVQWCVCSEFIDLTVDDPLVEKIANQIIFTINNMLEKNDVAKEKCAQLTLSKIERASRMLDNGKRFVTLEIVVRASPSQGLYEALIEYDIKTSVASVNADISRINRYGEQPKCIAKQFPYLRKYCYCK